MSIWCFPGFKHQRRLGPALPTGSSIQLHMWSFRLQMRRQTAIVFSSCSWRRRRPLSLRAAPTPAGQHNVERQTFPPKCWKSVFWLHESLLESSFTRSPGQALYTPIPLIPIGETISIQILNHLQQTLQFHNTAKELWPELLAALWLVLDWCIHTTLNTLVDHALWVNSLMFVGATHVSLLRPPLPRKYFTPWMCDQESRQHPVLLVTNPDRISVAILNLNGSFLSFSTQ